MGLEPQIEVLEYCDENNWQDMEIYWIAQMRAWGFNLTNIAIGGTGVKNMSKETKEKIKIANTGKPAWNKGILCKEETKEKLKISLAGRSAWNKGIPSPKGKLSPCYGKKKSPETIKKRLDSYNSRSFLEKEAHKKLISKANSKIILQYTKNMTFIKEWESATEARKNLNIKGCHIGDCCRGLRKSAGGFIWKFK